MFAASVFLLAIAGSAQHVEALASGGFVGSSIGNDGYAEALGGGGSVGIVGSYRYSLAKWLEVGATADVHYFAARSDARFSPSVTTSLVGSIRFRTRRTRAFIADVGAGVLRIDSSVELSESGHTHAWATVPCGRVAFGGILPIAGSTSFVFQAAIFVAYGQHGLDGDRRGEIHATGDMVIGGVHFEVGGRFDL